MGEEKKITITGVDSVLIDYDMVNSSFVAPGSFIIDPVTPDKDYVKSRKLVEVFVYDKDGLLLAAQNVSNATTSIEIVTESDSIVVADYAEGNDSRIYIHYPRVTFRGGLRGQYSRGIHIKSVKVNNVDFAVLNKYGTVQIFYREKLSIPPSTI